MKNRRFTTTEGMFLLLKRLFGRGSVPNKVFDETDVDSAEPQPKQELPERKWLMTDEENIRLTSTSVAQEDAPPEVPDQCNDDVWNSILALITSVSKNVLYGPGRGLWEDGKFLLTYAPGRRSKPSDIDPNSKEHWLNVRHALYPALHCTSWCNTFLAWLLRFNEDFTHAGTIPQLFDLCSKIGLQVVPQKEGWTLRYRGYGEHCYEIESNGSTKSRVRSLIRGKAYIDAMELYERRSEMPSVVVFGQSTKQADGSWNEWHHTGMFLFREGRMHRSAADGYAARGTYSSSPMGWTEITPENIGKLDLCRYRVYGVRTNADGTYGDQTRPVAEVTFE